MIPAPAIMPRSMSFSEAIPSSRTRQLSMSALRVKRSTSAVVSISTVLIETLSGLHAEVALRHELLHALVDVEAIAECLLEVLGHLPDGVETEQLGEEERSHRRCLGVRDRLIDVLDVRAGLLLIAPDPRHARVADAVD